jgi:hypothetical protein
MSKKRNHTELIKHPSGPVLGWFIRWPTGENGFIRNKGPNYENLAKARQAQGAEIVPHYGDNVVFLH